MDKRHKGSASNFGKKTFAVVLATATLCWGISFAMFAPVMMNTAEAAATTAHPNGVLVDIGDANHTIYLITGGQRQGIPSPTVFASYGYSFGKVVAANSYDQALPEGDVIKYADGTIVNDNGTMFLIGNGQKRGFSSADVFTGLGYSFTGSSVVVPESTYAGTFATYTAGSPVSSATEAHPNGALVDINGTAFQISNGTLVGIPSQAILSSHGLSLSNVVMSNAADKALTVGANMKFADGTIVVDSTSGTPTAYVISDGTKMGITTPAALEAYGYAWGNLVEGDVSSYPEGALITDSGTTTPDVPATTGTNAVSVSSTSPVAGVVARGAQDAVFMDVIFTAADATGYTISSLAITRDSISADLDLTAVELYEGSTRQGSAQALNTTTHKATFTGLNIAVTASTPRTITIKGDLYSSAGIGNSVSLGIASASDITATATIAGTFPMFSAAKTVATAAVGSVAVDTLSTPANSDIISGSVSQQVGSIKFTSSGEAINVNSFRLTQVGTAGDSDVSNITIKYGAITLATVAGFSNSMATISLSPALEIKSGGNKTVDVYVDVASGINTSRTVIVEVTQSTDVSALGTSSSGIVTVTGTFPEQGATHTISQGTLGTAKDSSTDPSAQNYVKGTSARDITSLRMSTGSTEGARVTQIKFTGAGTATPTDVSNFTLWKDGEMISTGSITGTTSTFTVQFGTNTTNSFDSPGLFDIAKSSYAVVTVKADISTAATNGHTIIMNIAALTDVKADGLGSLMDIPSVDVTGTTTGSTLTIATSGSLAVSLNNATPAAATKGEGNTNVEFTKFDLTAGTGEDIIVSTIIVRAFDTDTDREDTASTGDITNAKLYDGTTQLGSSVSSLTNGVASFNANITIAAGATKTLTVKADIPTGSGATTGIHFDVVGTTAGDIVSVGASSGEDISESGTATGKFMTIADPTIVGAMSASPAAATKVVNSTGVIIGRLLLTAGASDDVKVSTIKVRFDNASGLATGSSASTELRNVNLYDGSTKIGQTVNTITDSEAADGVAGADYAQFTGITNLTVAKNATKAIDIKVDLVSGTTGYYCGIAAGDVTGSGVISATSVTSTGTGVSAALTLAANGTMTASVDTSSPVNANIAVGTSGVAGVEMAKYRFTTTYEPVKISSLMLTLSGGATSDFVKVQLYADGVQIGPDGYLSGSTVTFNFPTGSEYVVPADDYKIITVKSDLNGVGSGVTHAHAPIWTIADASSDVTEIGGQSDASITDATSSTLTPAAKTLYKTIATVSKNTTLSSVDVDGGAATASATQKVLAVDITNGGTADLTITVFNVTPVFSGTSSATEGIKLYWSTDLGTQITGGAGGSGAILTTGTEVAMTPSANNTVPAGETKTIIVQADTSGLGATVTNTFHLDMPAVSDFGWVPAGGSVVTTLTKNLPITGPTYTYAH